MAYDLSVPSSGAKGIYFRDYRGISDVKLFNDVNSMPWDQIYAAPNIDEKLFFFNQLVSSLFQSNVQLSKNNASKVHLAHGIMITSTTQ